MNGVSYKKETLGAETVYQPDDLFEYKDDAWDLRVSIGDNPLDESFYITIEDPREDRQSIKDLLNKYALDVAKKVDLDINDDPDLPFYMDELIHLFEAEKQQQLNLDFYINHGAQVRLYHKAEQHLSVCTYDDNSLDYRLLDLVVCPSIKEPPSWERTKIEEWYDHYFLLHLMMYHDWLEIAQMSDELQRELYKRLGNNSSLQLFELIKDGFVIQGLKVTDEALAYGKQLDETLSDYQTRYSAYGSVSIEPPAVGIEQGFDVSLQMMELDDIDLVEALIHKVLDSRCDELFDLETWQDNYKERHGLEEVYSALAYKTHFSLEVLNSIKAVS